MALETIETIETEISIGEGANKIHFRKTLDDKLKASVDCVSLPAIEID